MNNEVKCKKCGVKFALTPNKFEDKSILGKCPDCGEVVRFELGKKGKIYGAIIAVVLVGLIVDLVIEKVKENDVQQTQATTAVASLPTPSEKVIYGLKPADVYVALENNGFTITKELNPCCSYYASINSGNTRISVEIYSSNTTSVNRVNASVVGPSSKDLVRFASNQFTSIIDIALQYNQAIKSKAIAELDLKNAGIKEYDGLKLEIGKGNGQGYFMFIWY